ncbi:MAG: hypothetical protein CSA62_04900 [Planctomycetota bacterium]|nr:MAG: hypothetical protein CSA62_04900 [Planctomycetota bacterium]
MLIKPSLLLLLLASTPWAQAVQEDAPLPALVDEYLAARGERRDQLEGLLRRSGAKAGFELLDRLEKAGALDAQSLALLLGLAPTAASGRIRAQLPRLDHGGRALALAWLARRDVPGWRKAMGERVGALLDFVDGGGVLGLEAAKRLADWDEDSVARALAQRLRAFLRGESQLELALARRLAQSFAQLDASKRHIEGLVPLAAKRDPTLLPSLLEALGRRADLVLAGALDPWIETVAPTMAQAVGRAFAQAEFQLFVEMRHLERVQLLRHCRERSLRPTHWALAEAHAALFSLGDPSLAEPALRLLGRSTLRGNEAGEAAGMRAISALLAGGDASPALLRAEQHSQRAFARARAEAMRGEESGAGADFQIFREWRQLLPPKVGAQDFEERLARLRRRGGSVFDRLRVAGRRYLATQLLCLVIHGLQGRDKASAAALSRALRTWEEISLEWNEDMLGPNYELDAALQLRAGPIQLLDQALEGNERAAARLDDQERTRRLKLAERGYRLLVDGLARKLPERVLDGPWATGEPMRGEREYVYSQLTGLMASFYERIGEEDAAIELYEHLIGRLKDAGESGNRRLRAGYLFSRASIAMDRKDAETSRRCLEQYVEYYASRYRDVVQNPERYFDPVASKAWLAARLAQGYVSFAVLHNVVLHETDTARGYIEKAYTLDASIFNRVLYACYLARAGRKEKALELIGSIDPQPPLYYNLACTYALCENREEALRFLALDLEKNHPTRKSRNRQRNWASGDRDLSSLHKDPRFKALVRPRTSGEER